MICNVTGSNLHRSVLFFQGAESKRHKHGLSTPQSQSAEAQQLASVQLIR